MERNPAARNSLLLLALAMVLAMTTWFSAAAVLPQLRAAWSLGTGESARASRRRRALAS